MDTKNYLEFLKRDRRAGNEIFQNKLKEIGLPIIPGSYGCFDIDPYVEIGHCMIYLKEPDFTDENGCSTRYRMQDDVIREIREAIAEAMKADQEVQDFFDGIATIGSEE